MIGPTGVGKTEIARRLAGLARAPFLKIEASKFTEVGYVGRDVESMIRDLVDIAVSKVKAEAAHKVQPSAEAAAEEKLLDLLLPLPEINSDDDPPTLADTTPAVVHARSELRQKRERTRDKMRTKLKSGILEDKTVELDVSEDSLSMMQIFSPVGIEEMGLNIQDLFGGIMPKKRKKRKTFQADRHGQGHHRCDRPDREPWHRLRGRIGQDRR
jgi:ATP-dependent HslUV protease ATP-binding subunit HslU